MMHQKSPTRTFKDHKEKEEAVSEQNYEVFRAVAL